MNDVGSGVRSVSLRTDEYQIHDVTNALKRFLRNLDDPLLTRNLSPRWTQAAGLSILCPELFGFVQNLLLSCSLIRLSHFYAFLLVLFMLSTVPACFI